MPLSECLGLLGLRTTYNRQSDSTQPHTAAIHRQLKIQTTT